MAEHIVTVAQMVKEYVGKWEDVDVWRKIIPRCEVIVDEMKQLQPRNFAPDAQTDFVIVRQELDEFHRQLIDRTVLSSFLNSDRGDARYRAGLIAKMDRVISVMEKYGGEDRASIRRFPFIKDADLRQIVERDYTEVKGKSYPARAWKSTVIMAGSIAEAMLFDVLFSDPARKASAFASPEAPKKGGCIQPENEWRLASLFAVAVDLGIVPKGRGATLDEVLRDYRNFVHPKKEIKAAHPCGEAEAGLAISGLDALCNFLERP